MSKNSLRDKLLKNTTINTTDVLSQSVLYTEKDMIPTMVPMINVALSGTFDGGLIPGVTMLAGPSKHFKTAFCLLLVRAYLAKYPDAIVLFYDSEFGAPISYFENFGIPGDSVVHTPITNLEELRHDLTVQLKELKRDDKVIIFLDSLGNVASIKEVTDAEEGKSTADMTRAKVIKSLFRIITPHLTLKNIPLVAVNHTYSEIGMFPKEVVSGGTGSYYNSNDIWIIGRQQDKVGEGSNSRLTGYNFVINIEKSRSVKEKSKIAVNVSFEDGIYIWSGLWDNAEEFGLIKNPTKGWYTIGDSDEKHRKGDLEDNNEFWQELVKNEGFKKFIEDKYKLKGSMIGAGNG